MNFINRGKRKFASQIIKEFKLNKKDLKELNNAIKEPWVKPGWDKIV
jgi:hypothetical protein